jgi:hypothetical protein
LLYIGQGIAVGGLIGLPGREADIAFAQHWAALWLGASRLCLGGSIVCGTFALPLYADASRVPRFIARFILASISSLALTVVIGIVTLSIITTLHRAH